MPTTFDEGICIRQWDFSETSQTVSLFGRSLGVVRGLAKGARRERGAFDGGIDLLSRGRFGVILRRGRELATLTEWDPVELYPQLRADLAANHAAFYMADLVGRMLQPEDPHPRLYDAMVAALRALGTVRTSDEPDASGGLALLVFQWSLLGETGFQPRLDLPSAGHVVEFSPESGGLVHDATVPGVRWKVRRSTVECLLAVSLGIAPAGDAQVVDRANRLLAAHLRHTLGSEPPTMRLVFGARGPISDPASRAP
jgi:DNA repair protein RecO (recombination protein O)